MPPDMAKRVNESINRKHITPEDELQDAFSDIANDLRLIEPDPSDWSWWVSYLLEQMGAEAERMGMHDIYKPMLRSLKQDLGNRINSD